MKIRLVKHVVDAHAEKVTFQLYRDIEISFIPHTSLIVTDAHGSEFIQAMGFVLGKNRFEALVFPQFVTEERPAESVKTDLEKSGWALDKGGSVMVDFEGKLDEEQAIRDYIAEEPDETVADPEATDDSENNWKAEHDKLYQETETDEEGGK